MSLKRKASEGKIYGRAKRTKLSKISRTYSNVPKSKMSASGGVVVKAPGCMPTSLVTKFTYGYHGYTSGVALDTNIIRLNSLYDPDFSATGHQPAGFDNMAALYNRYRVDKVEIRFWFTSTSTTPSIITAVPNNDATAFVEANNAMEQPFARTFTVSQSQPYHFVQTYYPHRITGVPKTKYVSDDLYQAAKTTNPSEVITLHFCNTDQTQAGSANTYINGKIILHATWYDPIDLGLS